MSKRVFREVRRRIFSRIYVDRNKDEKRTVMISGTGRSGTTWLAELVNYDNYYRVMFEPFHTRVLKQFGISNPFSYIPENSQDTECLKYIRQVCTGNIKSCWVDAHNRRFFCSRRLIKDVSSTLFLPWFTREMAEVPVVLLVRHPAPVCLSRLAVGWSSNMQYYLEQDQLMKDYLEPFRDMMISADDEFSKAVIEWCIHYLVPFKGLKSQVLPVCYEDMVLNPESTMREIFRYIGKPFSQRVLKGLDQPSLTARDNQRLELSLKRLSSWQQQLTRQQMDDMLRILEAFGMNRYYSEDVMPLVSAADMLEGRHSCE